MIHNNIIQYNMIMTHNIMLYNYKYIIRQYD